MTPRRAHWPRPSEPLDCPISRETRRALTVGTVDLRHRFRDDVPAFITRASDADLRPIEEQSAEPLLVHWLKRARRRLILRTRFRRALFDRLRAE